MIAIVLVLEFVFQEWRPELALALALVVPEDRCVLDLVEIAGIGKAGSVKEHEVVEW